MSLLTKMNVDDYTKTLDNTIKDIRNIVTKSMLKNEQMEISSLQSKQRISRNCQLECNGRLSKECQSNCVARNIKTLKPDGFLSKYSQKFPTDVNILSREPAKSHFNRYRIGNIYDTHDDVSIASDLYATPIGVYEIDYSSWKKFISLLEKPTYEHQLKQFVRNLVQRNRAREFDIFTFKKMNNIIAKTESKIVIDAYLDADGS